MSRAGDFLLPVPGVRNRATTPKVIVMATMAAKKSSTGCERGTLELFTGILTLTKSAQQPDARREHQNRNDHQSKRAEKSSFGFRALGDGRLNRARSFARRERLV